MASSKGVRLTVVSLLAFAFSIGAFTLALAASGGECDTNYRILVKVGDVTTTKHLPGDIVKIPVGMKDITPDVPEAPLSRWGVELYTYSPIFGGPPDYPNGRATGAFCRPPCPCYFWLIPDSSWKTMWTPEWEIRKHIYHTTRVKFELRPLSDSEMNPWGYCCDSTLIPVHLQFERGYLTIQRPEHGCPYVYTWDGDDFVEDNTILPASEDKTRGEKEVIDYYLLNQPLVGENGFYHLQIREFEKERSFLNSFQLIEADHPYGTKVAIGEDGGLYEYKQKLPLIGCTDDKGNDHLEELKEEDGLYFTSNGSGYLLLEYYLPSDIPGSGNCQLSLEDLPKYMIKGGVVDKALPSSMGEKITIIGEGSSSIREIFPRANPYEGAIVIDLSDASPGEKVTIKLAYNSSYTADMIGCYIADFTPLPGNKIDLSTATHSRLGDITSLLRDQDKRMVNLQPGERIDLLFPADGAPEEGMKRDFVLISSGYYERIQRASVTPPEKFTLFPNYPNPFNPKTRISYSLPVGCQVSLEVYNITGERVATLVNQRQGAGYHRVTWDASGMASGIYLYRISAGSFNQTRKMVLLR